MADIIIDGSPSSVLYLKATSRSLVWVSSTTGYIFYVEGPGVDLHYRKTTDSGATWGNAVTIRTGTIQTFAIWYDKWTKDDSGDVIHIAFVDSGPDDIIYNSFSTASSK